MAIFKGYTKTIATNPEKRCTIHVIGVLHIKAMSYATIKKIENIPRNKNTAFFIEPSEDLIHQKKNYKHESVAFFFNTLIQYASQRNIPVFPLNAAEMPSHAHESLIEKCAAQAAEEEWMAKTIVNSINSNTISTAIIIIGNVHAKRLGMLLKSYDYDVNVNSIAPETPDEHILQSWRFAALGLERKAIDLSWLSTINRIIAQRLNKTPMNIQEQCWNDEETFTQYCTIVKRLMKIYPLEKAMIPITNKEQMFAQIAYNTARESLSLKKTIEVMPKTR